MSHLSFELNRNGNGPKSQYVTHNRPTPATAYNPRSMDAVQRLPMQPNADRWELDPRVASLLRSVSIQLPSGACVRLHLIWFRCQYLFAAEECLSLHISIILMLLWIASLSAAVGLCNPTPTSATSVGN
jgi:hypothetical protein